MLRLSDDLAKTLLKKIRDPKISSSGDNAFTYGSRKSIGLIDPTCAIGTECEYSIECPSPIIYPEISFIPNTVNGYFLYRKGELMVPMEKWEITRCLIDPNASDFQEKIDVHDCSVILPSDIDKLTCRTVKTLEKLLELEPAIMDCLNLDQ